MPKTKNVTAVLGPTNTGKTHLAVERMLAHGAGMIGLPLRLLAREIYDRVRVRAGDAAVALVTGEEKIVPAQPRYWVSTVEAMPDDIEVPFLAIDEVQLCADFERGHIFTHRLLHARGKYETMFLGAGTMAPLVRRLMPDAEIVGRERVPEDGPLILVANHVHLLDPPLVAAVAGRRVHPMAKRELFETPLIGRLEITDGQVRYRGEAVVALVGSREAVLAVRDDEVPIAWTGTPHPPMNCGPTPSER